MGVCGLDDILFLLFSTSVLFWAKRENDATHNNENEVALSSFPKRESLKSREESSNKRYLRHTYSTTPLLLPGFSLQPSFQMGALPQSSYSLFHQSCTQTVIPEYVPAVPHRQYNAYKQVPPVSMLSSYSEKEVADIVNRYTIAQISSLFQDMENEGLWESVLRVSKGISLANLSLKYLTQANVERAIRTLLNSHRLDKSVDFYFQYGEDILISDELIVLLFDACRSSEEKSMKLFKHLIPFQGRWKELVYCCCLSVIAQWSPSETMKLYKHFRQWQEEEQRIVKSSLSRFLSSSVLLQESGIVDSKELSKLHYLFHVIIPVVVEHYPEQVHHYVEDMMQREPEVAPDVFLKCLLCTKGKKNIFPYIDEFLVRSGKNSDRIECEPSDTAQVGMTLYNLRPSAMNLNSLISLLIYLEHQSTAKLVQQDDAMVFLSHARFEKLINRVPLDNTQARIICRTITEQKASWRLAVLVTSNMLQRQQFSVVPMLARHLSRAGKWSTAAAAMTMYMSQRRTQQLSPAELGMCVETCVKSGRWRCATFWVNRACDAGAVLPPDVYDNVFAASKHFPWETTSRLIQAILRCGGKWSEKGYLELVENCTKNGRMKELLRLVPPESLPTVKSTPKK